MEVHRLDYLKIRDTIGKPYDLTSNPPETFNCWTLITYLYPQAPHFEPEKIKEYIEMFNHNKDSLKWSEVLHPIEGDVLLMGKNNYYSHAGIILANNKLLHAKNGVGVVIEGINMVKLRYKNLKAYRWQ